MDPKIKQAIEYLKKADYTGYFSEMNDIVPNSLKTKFNELRMIFVSGNYPYNFHQQLEVFATIVDENSIGSNQQTLVALGQKIIFKGIWLADDGKKWTFEVQKFIIGNENDLREFNDIPVPIADWQEKLRKERNFKMAEAMFEDKEFEHDDLGTLANFNHKYVKK